MENIYFSTSEKLTYKEYINFLKRSDLKAQYPKENFKKRISILLKSTDVTITARNKRGTLVGICFGQTDFAYFLFLSDLGVARNYTRMGIGKKLLSLAVKAAGGEDNIDMITSVNYEAVPFYEACGFTKMKSGYAKWCKKFTPLGVK